MKIAINSSTGWYLSFRGITADFINSNSTQTEWDGISVSFVCRDDNYPAKISTLFGLQFRKHLDLGICLYCHQIVRFLNVAAAV